MSSQQAGDIETAFANLRETLHAAVQAVVGCPHVAEDLVQETYLRASTAARTRPIRRAQPFLFRTARNLALDHLRWRRRTDALFTRESASAMVSSAPPPEAAAAAGQRLTRLERAIAGLPDNARRIVILHRVHGWRLADVAEHLGISLSTAEKTLRKALAACMAAAPPDE